MKTQSLLFFILIFLFCACETPSESPSVEGGEVSSFYTDLEQEISDINSILDTTKIINDSLKSLEIVEKEFAVEKVKYVLQGLTDAYEKVNTLKSKIAEQENKIKSLQKQKTEQDNADSEQSNEAQGKGGSAFTATVARESVEKREEMINYYKSFFEDLNKIISQRSDKQINLKKIIEKQQQKIIDQDSIIQKIRAERVLTQDSLNALNKKIGEANQKLIDSKNKHDSTMSALKLSLENQTLDMYLKIAHSYWDEYNRIINDRGFWGVKQINTSKIKQMLLKNAKSNYENANRIRLDNNITRQIKEIESLIKKP